MYNLFAKVIRPALSAQHKGESMKELMSSILIVGLFIVYSYFIHKYLRKVKSKISVIAIIVFYVLTLWPYFELVNRMHQILRANKYYIEFGHASILLVELAFLCLIIAIVNVIWATVKRKR